MYIGGGTQPQRSFIEYFKKRFRRLLVPYFTFEIVNLIIWIVKCLLEHQPLPGIDCLISIIICVNNSYSGLYGRLWFLPCIFVADIYVWVILHFFRKKQFALILSTLVLFAASFVTSKIIKARLPFTLDTALFGAAFIMLGFLFYETIDILIKKGNDACKIILAIGMLTYLVYSVRYTPVSVLMYINSYGEYTVSICSAISGSIAYIILASYMYSTLRKWSPVKRLVLWYGNNSLATFPVHLTIKMFILWYVPLLRPWYMMFPSMLFLSIPIVNFITRYLPFMLGKKYTDLMAGS